jgi:integrase
VDQRRLEIRTTVVEVNGVQHVSSPKTYEERSVPVPSTLMRMLESAAAGRTADQPLFPSPRVGGHLRNRVFRRGRFDQASADVGLDGLVPHELRHTAASLAVSAGANVLMVSRMLGHKSPKETLDTYAGLFEADVDIVAERLDEGLAATDVGKMLGKSLTRPKKVRAP